MIPDTVAATTVAISHFRLLLISSPYAGRSTETSSCARPLPWTFMSCATGVLLASPPPIGRTVIGASGLRACHGLKLLAGTLMDKTRR